MAVQQLGAAPSDPFDTVRVADLPTVSVMVHGAVGNGVADDTAAIHAARDAAGEGGTLHFPAGTYLVDGLTASVSGQQWTLSDGAIIKLKTGATYALTITAADITVNGGVIDGSNGTERDWTQGCIKVNADGFSIHEAVIQNSAQLGIFALNVNRVMITRCHFTGNYGISIFVQNTLTAPSNIYDVSITDNTIDESASSSEYVSGVGVHSNGYTQRINRVVISGNKIVLPYNQTSDVTGAVGLVNASDFGVTDNVCVGGNISISVPNAVMGVISNNTVRGFDTIGIELPGSGSGEVNSVTVSGNVIDPDGTTAAAAIQTSNANIKNVTISGNTIKGFTAGCNAINFGVGSVCQLVTVSGNTIETAIAGSVGVLFANSVTGLTLGGNSIDGASAANSYGVQFLHNVTGAAISGNQFSNISTAAVSLAAYTSGKVLDYIKLSGNVVVNCGATLSDQTSGGATVGSNIVNGDATAAAANTVALRDANTNLFADAFIPSLTSTATAAATTTLTVDSKEVQVFTGTTTQTCQLPTTSVAAGRRFTVVNNSTGIVTVTASGGATVAALSGSTAGVFVAIQATPTAAAHWAFSLSNVLLSGGALGTPLSGTLTNCTGLPVAGITASTSTALGIGSLEVGHATDCTITRSAAGTLAVEGVDVVTTTGAQSLSLKQLASPAFTGYYPTEVLTTGFTTIQRSIATTNNALGSQALRVFYFIAPVSGTFSNITTVGGTTAAGATPTLVRFGVWSVDGSGTLTPVKFTDNDTTLYAVASTVTTKAFPSSFTLTAGQLYAWGILVVSSYTYPTIVGAPPPASAAEMALAPRLNAVLGSQTDLPAGTIANASFNATSTCPPLYARFT